MERTLASNRARQKAGPLAEPRCGAIVKMGRSFRARKFRFRIFDSARPENWSLTQDIVFFNEDFATEERAERRIRILRELNPFADSILVGINASFLALIPSGSKKNNRKISNFR